MTNEDIRDCENCKHYVLHDKTVNLPPIYACEEWKCEFEPKGKIMPNSLRMKLSKLRFQGKITQDEYKELIEKLGGHDEVLVAQIKWERDTAIEQLKQLGYGLGEKVEPCEDCISRKAALDELDKYIDKAQSTGTRDDFISFQELVVKQLPSVKPQRPKGEWIEQTDKNKKLYGWFYCSECGAVLGRVDGANYCSECGAKMEGDNE